MVPSEAWRGPSDNGNPGGMRGVAGSGNHMAGTEGAGAPEQRARGLRAFRWRRRLEARPLSDWAAEEYAGNGPGGGAASLGFTGYDPSRPRAAESSDRVTLAAVAEVEFLAPKQSVAGFEPRDRTLVDPTAAGF
jgi:hypothetical protein